MAESFILFFDSKLDVKVENPTINKKSLAKIIGLKGKYHLCDKWRVTDMKSKQFTFAQKNSSSFI